jgi:hypothetical protein
MKIPILSQILAAIFRRFTLTVPAFQPSALTPPLGQRLPRLIYRLEPGF